MEKKYIIIMSIVSIVFSGIVLGIASINNNKLGILQKQIDLKGIEKESKSENKIYSVTTSSKEEKTTPNTVLIFKTYYKECKHTAEIKQYITEELVNKTKEELEIKYEEWKIQSFKKNEIIFYKEQEGICNEHYIIKDNEGYVCVYLIYSNQEKNKQEILVEVTEIITDYLPETDKRALKEGIKVVGRDKLNATLEDYE